MEKLNNLWLRLGITLQITDEEAKILMSDSENANETLRNIIKENRFNTDGESYIPECCVEDYNEENGTDFEVCDYDFLL